MVKQDKERVFFKVTSISIPSSEKDLTKELNEIAKKDDQIPKGIVQKRSSLVSYVTIELWKLYISSNKKGTSLLKLKERFENESSSIKNKEENISSN